MASIRKKMGGKTSAITRMQREKKELQFVADSRAKQLQKAGLPVRSPRLRKKS